MSEKEKKEYPLINLGYDKTYSITIDEDVRIRSYQAETLKRIFKNKKVQITFDSELLGTLTLCEDNLD